MEKINLNYAFTCLHVCCTRVFMCACSVYAYSMCVYVSVYVVHIVYVHACVSVHACIFLFVCVCVQYVCAYSVCVFMCSCLCVSVVPIVYVHACVGEIRQVP